MATNTVTSATAGELAAWKVQAISDNIKDQESRGRNLVNCVDADLNFKKRGMSFTSNSYADATFRPFGRANRFSKHDRDRLARGKRQANFADYECVVIESDYELVEEAVNPTSKIPMKMAEAHTYLQDGLIMQVATAAVLEANDDATDDDGFNLLHNMTTVAFPAGQKVAVGYDGYHDGKADSKAKPAAADQGLTKGKLFRSLELLSKSRTRGKKILACASADILNLATSLQLTSQDFVNPKLLMDIDRVLSEESDLFLGLTFKPIWHELQPGHGTNAAKAILYIDNAIEYNEYVVKDLRIQELPEEHYNWQFYKGLRAAGLRNDDSAVVEITLNQTATPVE